MVESLGCLSAVPVHWSSAQLSVLLGRSHLPWKGFGEGPVVPGLQHSLESSRNSCRSGSVALELFPSLSTWEYNDAQVKNHAFSSVLLVLAYCFVIYSFGMQTSEVIYFFSCSHMMRLPGGVRLHQNQQSTFWKHLLSAEPQLHS